MSLRRGGEEVVERAAFVGFVVREGDVAQARERRHGADRLGDERKHALRAGVEKRLSSSAIRYWLKLNSGPPGIWIGVLMRKMPAAISWTLVPELAFVIMAGFLMGGG